MTPAAHPLAQVRAELEELATRGDAARLGALLSGEGLPSLGGHEEPAELIHRAIFLQPYRPQLVEQLAPVLGAYLRERSRQPERSAGLRNGLLLAELLPRLEPIFEGVAAVFEAIPEFAADIDRPDDPQEIGARLREALRWQQTDSRVLSFWHRLFDSQKAEDLQDGLQGVFWLQPPPGEPDAAYAARIELGLRSFAIGAERAGESQSLLVWAIHALDDASPRSADFWQRHLAPLASNWPHDLKQAFQNRWPSVELPALAADRNALAKSLKRLREFEKSEKIYRETINEFPRDLTARNGLAGLLRSRGKLEESERLYRETARRFPENVITLCGLAEVLKKRGKLAEAERLYDETVKKFPESKVARHGFANLLRQKRQFEAALQHLPEPRQLVTKDDFFDQHLRAMILLGQGDQNEAERLLKSGLAACPFAKSKVYFANALALIALRRGDWTSALDHVRKVHSPVAKVLQFHAHAGLQDVPRTRLIESELQGRILPIPVRQSLEAVKLGFGLNSGNILRQPTSEESARIFELEIEMLSVAA